tara:strand:+ start:114 stop:293 length:180 start_codon:yes stop_codon:yes gene_type:complete
MNFRAVLHPVMDTLLQVINLSYTGIAPTAKPLTNNSIKQWESKKIASRRSITEKQKYRK